MQDHMFEPVISYSLPSHLYLVSNWSATCPISGTPIATTPLPDPPYHNGGTCYEDAGTPQAISHQYGNGTPQAYPNYAWTDITYLLNNHELNAAGTPVLPGTPGGTPAPIDWGYFVGDGTTWQQYCGTDVPATPTVYPTALQTVFTGEVGGAACHPTAQPTNGTGEFWNPLVFFSDVHFDGTALAGTPIPQSGYGQLGNIHLHSAFAAKATAGALPPVSWVVPPSDQSDHPPYNPLEGQDFVNWVIKNLESNATAWRHTAVFVAWDDWGGFYDHVLPAQPAGNDQDGYGIRVPGLVLGPYAKHCYIDKQRLSFDAYNTFLEDDFLGGQRLDPTTDGRPDARNTPQPIPRETAMPTLPATGQEADLANDFYWNRTTFTDPPTFATNATPGATYAPPDGTYCAS